MPCAVLVERLTGSPVSHGMHGDSRSPLAKRIRQIVYVSLATQPGIVGMWDQPLDRRALNSPGRPRARRLRGFRALIGSITFLLLTGPMHSRTCSRGGFALAAIDETDQLAFLAEGFAGLFPDPVNVLSDRACRALS